MVIQPHNNNTSKRKTSESESDHDHAPLPPFKFHRIWTEPDEIRFLQGLLHCSLQNLAFPRDLPIFYARFSATISQPYTKSQLSEKLRRLRKKFCVIFTRLSRGMDPSQLSLHDRVLYDLSKCLWHPDFAATSPFSGGRNVGLNHCNNVGYGGDDDDEYDNDDEKLKSSSLVGIKVEFSPTLPADGGNVNGDGGRFGLGDFRNDDDDGVKLSEVNVDFEGEEAAVGADNEEDDASQKVDLKCENEIGEVVAKVVINLYDECFKEVKRLICGGSDERVGAESFHARWQQQRIAELDVLGRRLRFFLEHSLTKKLSCD